MEPSGLACACVDHVVDVVDVADVVGEVPSVLEGGSALAVAFDLEVCQTEVPFLRGSAC